MKNASGNEAFSWRQAVLQFSGVILANLTSSAYLPMSVRMIWARFSSPVGQ